MPKPRRIHETGAQESNVRSRQSDIESNHQGAQRSGKLTERRSGMKELSEKVDNHLKDYATRSKEEERRWESLIEAQEGLVESQAENTVAINSLTAAMDKQVESTEGLVEAWQTAESVIKVSGILGRFFKWISGLAVVGAGFSWLIHKLGE